MIPRRRRLGTRPPRSKKLSARHSRRVRPHTRVIIRDCKQAFLGSQSLRKLELEQRREIGIIVNNSKIVRSLITVFEDDWQASAVADRSGRTRLQKSQQDD